jgi:hypothetical protein
MTSFEWSPQSIGLLLALAAWVAWWLLCVDWQKAWQVLALGASVPVILILVVVALVWSQIMPSSATLFGAVTLANFWWQLLLLVVLAGLALFCGWLQGVIAWQPLVVEVEPVADHSHASHGEHDHGHAPEHHAAHAPVHGNGHHGHG